jgi:hypothetical protein
MLRLTGSEKIWDRGAALTSRLQTFETEMLAEEENFRSLARIDREFIGKVEALDSPQRAVLDRDSTGIPGYGLTVVAQSCGPVTGTVPTTGRAAAAASDEWQVENN